MAAPPAVTGELFTVSQSPVIGATYNQARNARQASENSGIASRCVYLKFTVSILGNARKVATSQVDTRDADPALIHVAKTLLDSPELKAISEADGKMRRRLDDLCLPFDTGVRFLPIALIETVDAELTDYASRRDDLVELFMRVYEDRQAEARRRLGDLFDPLDYPDAEAVRARFTASWQYVSFGTPAELADVSPEIWQREKEKAAQALEAAEQEVIAVMRETAAQLVKHLSERLSPDEEGKPRKLRATTVDNLKDFLSTFDLRNVGNDAELKAQVEKARAILTGINAPALRDNEALRDAVRRDLAQVGSRLGELVEETATRSFRTVSRPPDVV